MYKLVKWAYELGVKNERKRIENGLFRRLGGKPSESDIQKWEYKDQKELNRELDRRLTEYYAVAHHLEGYFHPMTPPTFLPPEDLGVTVND